MHPFAGAQVHVPGLKPDRSDPGVGSVPFHSQPAQHRIGGVSNLCRPTDPGICAVAEGGGQRDNRIVLMRDPGLGQQHCIGAVGSCRSAFK